MKCNRQKTLYVLKRHSLDDEIEDIQDDGNEDLPETEEITPISIFFTINGLYIISSLALFSVIYFATDIINK